MVFSRSDPAPSVPETSPIPVKIVVSGGFAVGKTTLVASISEIEPLTTEAALTTVSAGVDHTGSAHTKSGTTVAMDFGRISLAPDLVLYLFGTPGQDRFRFMWDDLSRGAIGAVVLVDTTRLDECFGAIDYFEHLGVPFVVAINAFDGEVVHDHGDVREALSIPHDVPLLITDARDREATRRVLLELVKHAMAMAERAAGATS